jgi:GNAT superfamily N-acetyltransferase
MAEPSIRRAGPHDAETLAQLGEATFCETFLEDGFAIPYPSADLKVFLAAHYTPAAFAARLADAHTALWVAEQDGKALAYADAGPCGLPHLEASARDPELRRLYVLRRAQGLGLGRRLLEIALDWMDGFGGAAQWLGVWSGNLKAQRLYAAYGFEPVGDYTFAVGSWRDDEFILRRPMPAAFTRMNGAS